MTLIELLVVMVVISLLVAVSVPGLFWARRAATTIKCSAAIRSAGLSLQVYSIDHRDALPNGGPVLSEVVIPECNKFTVGGVWGLSNGLWTALFPDEWHGPRWDPGMWCPKQPAWNPALPPWDGPLIDGQLQTPTYWMSPAMWLDAATLDGVQGWDAVRPRQNFASDIAFPSKKVILYEAIAYCATEPDARFWIGLGQTPLCRSAVLACDGSVWRLRPVDALPPPDGAWLFATLNGVYGQDLP